MKELKKYEKTIIVHEALVEYAVDLAVRNLIKCMYRFRECNKENLYSFRIDNIPSDRPLGIAIRLGWSVCSK